MHSYFWVSMIEALPELLAWGWNDALAIACLCMLCFQEVNDETLRLRLCETFSRLCCILEPLGKQILLFISQIPVILRWFLPDIKTVLVEVLALHSIGQR